MKLYKVIKLTIKEDFTELGLRILIKTQQYEESINSAEATANKTILFGTVAVGLFLCMAGYAEAVTVESLRAPIQDLKKEVFGGWMHVVKIAAIAVGSVFSVVKQSLIPFGMGGGTAAGIHFGDKWIGDGSGALI